MNSLDKFVSRTIKYSLIVFLIEVIFILVLSNEPQRHILGLLLGYVMNLVFFRLMYLNVHAKVGMQKKKAIMYTRLNYAARFILTGLILYLSIKSPYLSLLTCTIALFNVRFAIYLSTIVDAFRPKKLS